MDKRRASEITASQNMIDVTYNGELVYIENVNPVRDMASIHYLRQPHFSQEVPVTQLVEGK